MANNVYTQITLYYTIGDSPVRHTETVETEISRDAFRLINTYTTRTETLRKIFSNRVPGVITGGEAREWKQQDNDKPIRSDSNSIWRTPYWLIPFRLIWKLIVGTIKFFWDSATNANS